MKKIRFLGPNFVSREVTAEDFAAVGAPGQVGISLPATHSPLIDRVVEIDNVAADVLIAREPGMWEEVSAEESQTEEPVSEAPETTESTEEKKAVRPRPTKKASGS